VRVFAVGALFVVVAIAVTYAVQALAPDISPLGRFVVMAPVYVGGGLCVRAAAVRRRRDRQQDELS
jgi:uncharacterized membrane protein